jgi:hypothetical protein
MLTTLLLVQKAEEPPQGRQCASFGTPNLLRFYWFYIKRITKRTVTRDTTVQQVAWLTDNLH